MHKSGSGLSLRAAPAAAQRRKLFVWSLAALVALILGRMMLSGVQPRSSAHVLAHREGAAAGGAAVGAGSAALASAEGEEEDVDEPDEDLKPDAADADTDAAGDDDDDAALDAEEEAEEPAEREGQAAGAAADEGEPQGAASEDAEPQEQGGKGRQGAPVAEELPPLDPSQAAAAEQPPQEEPGGAGSPAAAGGKPAAQPSAQGVDEEKQQRAANATAAADKRHPEEEPEAASEADGAGKDAAAAAAPAPATKAAASAPQPAGAAGTNTTAAGDAGQQAPRPAAASAPARAPAGDEGDEAPAGRGAFPRVALMFLTRGWMPHLAVWEEWLKGADGLLPAPALARQGCTAELVEAARGLTPNASAPLYQRQRLFSLYIHTQPNYNASAYDGTIFEGRRVAKLVPTQWGTHSLITAARSMVRAALSDPRNQRFWLLSESDVPLWPAGLTYLQLMAEGLSRVNACAPRSDAEARATDLGQAALLNITAARWRKSSQWFVLSRRHAVLFAEEKELDALFERECFVRRDIKTWKLRPGDRWCVSDEHYLPLLLADAGEEANCSCALTHLGTPRTTPTFLSWSSTSPHPKTFSAAELTGDGAAATLEAVRGCNASDARPALAGYPAWLVRPGEWSREACDGAAAALRAAAANDSAPVEVAAAAREWQPALLPPYMCALALRKAAPDAAKPLQDALAGGLLEDARQGNQSAPARR